jgi:hypothetical protein
MAATNFTPIQIYHSTTAGSVPTAGNLLPGELGLNIADMKLYCENSSGVVTLLASMTSPFTVLGNSTAGAELRLPEDTDNGSNYVALKSPDSLASNVTYTLPSADGSANQVLTTNGSGTLSWATAASAEAGGAIMINKTTASASYTFPSGTNGFSVGPITVSGGVVITVTSGQRWVVI